MKQQMKLQSTFAGANSTKTFGDVNPAVVNSVVRQTGQKFNALTRNIYVKTDRVITYSTDTDDSYVPPSENQEG